MCILYIEPHMTTTVWATFHQECRDWYITFVTPVQLFSNISYLISSKNNNSHNDHIHQCAYVRVCVCVNRHWMTLLLVNWQWWLYKTKTLYVWQLYSFSHGSFGIICIHTAYCYEFTNPNQFTRQLLILIIIYEITYSHTPMIMKQT